jgi:hypothetical protein
MLNEYGKEQIDHQHLITMSHTSIWEHSQAMNVNCRYWSDPLIHEHCRFSYLNINHTNSLHIVLFAIGFFIGKETERVGLTLPTEKYQRIYWPSVHEQRQWQFLLLNLIFMVRKFEKATMDIQSVTWKQSSSMKANEYTADTCSCYLFALLLELAFEKNIDLVLAVKFVEPTLVHQEFDGPYPAYPISSKIHTHTHTHTDEEWHWIGVSHQNILVNYEIFPDKSKKNVGDALSSSIQIVASVSKTKLHFSATASIFRVEDRVPLSRSDEHSLSNVWNRCQLNEGPQWEIRELQ